MAMLSRTKSKKAAAEDVDFVGTVHVYKPYKAGLPRLGPYFREVWHRREFLIEMSRAKVRSGQMGTVLGKAWNILNPLLMGVVYFLLVTILRGGRQGEGFFIYLLAGIFYFTILQNSMTSGATSVTSAGRMLTSTSFPRVLLPLSTVATSLRKFVPGVVVLAVLAIATGVTPKMTWFAALGMLVFFVIFSSGVAMFFAALTVYFRDTKDFLKYISRIGLYVSPILWTPAQLPQMLAIMEYINPAYPMVAGWSSSIVYGTWPTSTMWIAAAAWSIAALVIGFWFFVSRERDFAVRI